MTSPQAFLLYSLLAVQAAALDNGFGRTPPMGFNTYNPAACTLNQTWVRNTINAFSDKGFRTAGYSIFGLDCGWQGPQRQSNGSITYDPNGFPDGITPLSQLAISKGFVRPFTVPRTRLKTNSNVSNGACTLTKVSTHATLA